MSRRVMQDEAAGRKLTVVITCFNREKYLAASIESVLRSRFTDFELLVLDDASTDNSVEIAREYARKDDRIRVVVNDRNLGDYPNRNRALSLVETRYLKYHDSDDLMYPHCLGTMIELLSSHPESGFALTHGRAWQGGPCPMELTPRMAYQREFFGNGLFFCGPSGALFRTEVLRGLGGFEDYGPSSDYCFWLRACQTKTVLLVPGDLFWYRVHAEQESQKRGAASHYARTASLTWDALHESDCPLVAEERFRARRIFMRRLLKSSFRHLRAGRWEALRVMYGRGGFRVIDFLRHPPLKLSSVVAGTPVDDGGEFQVPDWLRLG